MSIGDKVTITIDGRTCEGVIVNDNTIQLQPRPRVVIIDSVPSKAYDAIHAAFMAADIKVEHPNVMTISEETRDALLEGLQGTAAGERMLERYKASELMAERMKQVAYLIDPNEPPTDGAKAVQHLRSRKRLRW